MARRKKEQNSTNKKNKVLGNTMRHSPNEENLHVDSIVGNKANVDDDGGNSSQDESVCEDSEILKPEDITNIVIGDLKTVCVTKATSDDESDSLSKLYRPPSAPPEPNRNFSTNPPVPVQAAPLPVPISTPPPCEHPKKKIVRLMNAAQYFKQDIVGSLKPTSADVKVEPKEFSAMYSNPVSVKYNGELPDLVVSSDSIKSEPGCDATSSPVLPRESPCPDDGEYKRVKAEDRSPRSRLPIENCTVANVSDERDSYQEIDELLVQTGPYLRNLASKLRAAEICCNSGSLSSSSSPLSQNNNVMIPPGDTLVGEMTQSSDHNQLKEIPEEDFELSIPLGAEDTIPNASFSVKLVSGAVDCDMSDSTIIPDKENAEAISSKLETASCKSSPEAKAIPQITTFDFLSCERSGKRSTKPEIFDQGAAATPRPTVTSKTCDAKFNDESISKTKNDVTIEKLKTDVKPKKSDEKTKKLPKKELSSKQGKKSFESKSIKDERERKDAKEVSASEKRRRSTRLKSKPEYNEKYEDLNLIPIPALPTNTAKEIVTNNLNNSSNDVSSKSEGKIDGLISAVISVEPEEMPVFEHIIENEYHTERIFSKDAERMVCDCMLTKEEIMRGESGCGEDCLNRLLLIECCSRCSLKDRCTNKRFQKREYAQCEVFKTLKKGNGLRALEDIPSGSFIMEYVGEVIAVEEFHRRAVEYASQSNAHFYFMALKSDYTIDATMKGNCSRFINHSCEPNAETQKWTVQGELRIGFFSKRAIRAGEEITFDYQLQRYGKQAQRCYCEAASCTGWIGEDPNKQQDDDKSGKEEKKKKKPRDPFVDVETALEEISQEGLINRHLTLNLNRLMVHAKELPVRMQILQLIEEGHPACRRLFVDYHGLPLIWSWMVDCTPSQDELKLQLLKTLMALPITNKTILVDSKVYTLVEQWAFGVDQKIQSEALSAQSVLESVEDISTADETPVSKMAQKVLSLWSSLREAYRIPKKERIQQMKEHEREADQNVVKPRPRRLPVYAEKIRDSYRRNRQNREFDKLYSDSWRRRDSPDSRDQHRKVDNSVNKISKMERRFMFEMKVAREKEEKEFFKRQKEEEDKYWLQQSSIYYSGQQHQMTAHSYSSTNQYMTAVPPPSYNADPVSQVVASQLMQSISSISSTGSSSSHPYYQTTAPPYMSQGMMLPHLGISQTPTSQSQSSTSSAMMPQQVSPSPTAQPYYQNLNVYQNNAASTATSYGHPAMAELPPKTEKAATTYASYDYPVMSSPNDTDSVGAAYSAYNENSLYARANNANADNSTATYASTDSKAIALANAATAAVDISKIKLPPKWKAARDSEGRLYYYHTKTRISQWYPPAWEEPHQIEVIEQSDADETTDDESSAGEDEDEESAAAKKRRHQTYDEYEAVTKRRILGDVDQNFDMDAELKENLAAMSCEFQDSENDDYEGDQRMGNVVDEQQQSDSTPPPSNIPLITEHIISPREPIDKEERIRNKKRIRSLKEKLRRKKRLHKNLSGVEDGSSLSGVLGISGALTSGSGGSNGGVNSISSSDSLLSVPADTSSITDRKRKDAFRSNMANFVVHCLNPYFRSTCTTARITNYTDFKHLARKLTHFVMLKELKHCRSATELTCNSSVKHKAKEYIRKYMSKFGEVYVRPPEDNINY